MKKHLIILAFFAASMAHAKLSVVATTPDIGSIAKDIGGEFIELTVLCKPTEDPHFVDARPSFILKLNRAEVLLEGGAELEIGYLPALLRGAKNPKINPGAKGYCSCARGIELLEKPAQLDRSKGDIHAAGNPHYLGDPLNAKIVGENITRVFCENDPKNCEGYRARLKRFQQEIDKKTAEWTGKLAPFKGNQIVTFHNSWLYFANRFGLKNIIYLEPKPGIPPTPGHLSGVVNKIKAEKIPLILVEPFSNRKTAESVARSSGIQLADVSHFPGGIKGTEGGYIALMDVLVESIAQKLKAAK